MITVKKTFQTASVYPLERLGAPEDLIFFDIETTGFSREYCQLYLIGCVYVKSGIWHLIQWLADSPEAEPELLHAFFDFIRPYKTLVHFNGDNFDIPFIQARCRHYHLETCFDNLQSIDIYKRVRPYRKLLGLDSLKQKAVEQFLHISRKDKFSGGELIEVYHDYLHSHSPVLYDLLMLHNEDDLKGMPEILPILNYPDFFEHDFSFSGHEISSETDLFGDELHSLVLKYQSSDVCLPVEIQYDNTPVSFRASGNELSFTIDLLEGELRHFYENYKDYYYLIYEDNAIHKSVGAYVSKDARKNATKSNCYTRQNGCFLPQFSPLWEPVFRRERTDKICYAALENVPFGSESELLTYLRQLFLQLGVTA